MPVKAPFRFARINRWIYEPAWAELVSHDVPFADGLSGKAEVEITARSSILVGGDRRKATAGKAGEVRPFQLPDKTYAIPGSALQGMTRAILEIASFGRLGPWIADLKYEECGQSARNLLGHSNPGHLDPVETMRLDLAHLIFGVAAEHDGGRGLKRRARFSLARAVNSPQSSCPDHPSILLSPKPSYVGLYVRQKGRDGRVADGKPMATYASRYRPEDPPELSGVKIWPARGAGKFDPGEIDPYLASNLKVQTHLITLPPKTVFRSQLTFHNLRPVELGALLWALSFGDANVFGTDPNKITKRHRLGMGKPLGLGEVAIRVTGLKTEPVCSSGVSLVRDFEQHMASVYGVSECQWSESKQVRALLKAATPPKNGETDLKYMTLKEYQIAKTDGEYLPEYAPSGSHEMSVPHPDTAVGAQQGGPAQAACPWVDETIENLRQTPGLPNEHLQVLAGRQLAEAWQAIKDKDLQQWALRDIRARWAVWGWWERPFGRAGKTARRIYGGESTP